MSSPRNRSEWIDALEEAIGFAEVIQTQIEPAMGPPVADILGLEFAGSTIPELYGYLSISQTVLGTMRDRMKRDEERNRIFGHRRWHRTPGGVFWPESPFQTDESEDDDLPG